MKSLAGLFAAACLAGIIALPGQAHADAHANAGGGGGGGAAYGTAGCGLGSILFGNQAGFMQVLAATTNGFFGSQTFGITSGTSNCVDAPSASGAVASFVQTNRPILAKDAARGSGETIATLSTLAGCSDASQVGRALQTSYRNIFSSAGLSDVQVSERVVNVLRSKPALACKKLI